MSTSSEPQLTPEQIQKTRAKFKRFRILVIGRANAGKTTILRAVCNTTDDPMIFDPSGKKIESAILDPSLKRGEHDIEDEMIFESNPGFVFHDSLGFDAGGDREFKVVQQFLQQRSGARNVNEQLHAIWYCIPTTDDRPITVAEKKLFDECGTGLVPVIVLWTKTEALDLAQILQLMKEGKSKADAMQQAPEKAWADFERDVYPRFAEFKYQPKAYVVFRKMHEPGGNCNELIEQTAEALSSEKLQQFFLSTQQNILKLCMEDEIRGITSKMENESCPERERPGRGLKPNGFVLFRNLFSNQKDSIVPKGETSKSMIQGKNITITGGKLINVGGDYHEHNTTYIVEESTTSAEYLKAILDTIERLETQFNSLSKQDNTTSDDSKQTLRDPTVHPRHATTNDDSQQTVDSPLHPPHVTKSDDSKADFAGLAAFATSTTRSHDRLNLIQFSK